MQSKIPHHEIPFAQQFTELAPQLLADFLQVHPEVLEQQEQQSKGDEEKYWHDINGWVPLGVLYQKQWADKERTIKNNYPTAHKLVKMFGDDVNVASYSLLKPGAKIPLHNGDEENRYCKYIRCHIPLMIPEGDMGLWVMGWFRQLRCTHCMVKCYHKQIGFHHRHTQISIGYRAQQVHA